MAPEAEPQVTPEPVVDPSKTQQQDPTVEPTGNGGQQQAPVIDKSTQLPEDHPLVTAHQTVKGKLATATTELAEARAQAAKTTQLQAELDKRPTAEALDTLQKRYDRLEAFLQGAGGDIATALDSRTFTRQLFETDEDMASIIKAWNKAHPSATSQALGGGAGGGTGGGKQDPNELIRAAWNGGSKD